MSLTGDVETGKTIARDGGGHAQARAPRARRQGAGGRLRRRRPGRGRRGDQDRRLLELRARTAPPRRASSRGRRSTTGCSRSSCRRSSRCGSATRPTAPTIEMGPVISKAQQERVFGFLDRAAGATVLTGGDVAGAARLLRRADGGHGCRPGRTRSCSARCSGRSSRCSASPTTPRRSRGRTTSATASPRRCGRATSAGRWRGAGKLQFGTVWINDHIPLVSRDAARRLQAVGLRQGPLDVLARGLHADQARDGQARVRRRLLRSIVTMLSPPQLHRRQFLAPRALLPVRDPTRHQ